jgi:hypothetical protein
VKKVVQVILAILFGLVLAVYITAKIHFFARYDPHRQWRYLREHWVYWALMAALALSIWLIQGLFPEKSDQHDNSKSR